ncbi:1854_t:CDS:2 [Paraglomus brasilianum]|uniref:1854_t:CDS:1 n=1 Tax=Paraglomus brasilianum TaxID=144538 RepID=A0A9N9H314_9GLOM|nr:1854_t:CDS:2 [Paraglomus brasilianum]
MKCRNAGHKLTVTGINWSPYNWKLFTTSSMDKTVKCWDSNYMVPVHTFDLRSRVYSHAMSPRARNSLVASALGDDFIRMCDIRHKVAVLTLSGHYKAVMAVQWSPLFHNILASAGEDGTVRIWDIRNPLRCLASLDYTNEGSLTSARNVGHTAPVNGLTFTHDGLHLLSTGQDNTLRLWDVYQGTNVLVEYGGGLVNRARLCVTLALTKSDKCIPPLVFHPTSNGRILIYDLFDGTLHDHLHGPMSSINCVVWRQHNQELYSGDGDKRILVWRSKVEEQEDENEDVCIEMNEQDAWSD